VSNSDFLKYYRAAAFEESNGATAAGRIPLKQLKNGSYSGSATVNFDTGGNIWPWLVPVGSQNVPGPSSYHSGAALIIDSSADTYAWQYGHETTQLTFVVIAFSIILAQPILETLLGLEKEEKKK